MYLLSFLLGPWKQWGLGPPFANGFLLTFCPPLPVRYRIFALDQNMRPSTDTLTVTVEVSL